MGLANLIETSGGIGGVYGAGVRHGIVERGLANDIDARVSYSVGGYNSVLEASGILNEAPEHYLRVAQELINKPGAVMQYVNKLNDRDPFKMLVGFIFNHPHWMSYSIGKIPNERIRKSFSSFMQSMTRAYEQIIDEFKKKEKEPIVNMHCLDEIINDVITPEYQEKIRNFQHPIFMAAYNLKEEKIDFLDARVHTIDALKATSSIVGFVRVNGERYTDSAFNVPINYEQLPENISPKPRIIVLNQGKRAWLGINEARYFFVAQWNREKWHQYAMFQGQESRDLKRLKKDDNVLVIRPNTEIAFSTNKKSVIDKTWLAGIRDSAKVEQFLEKLDKQSRIAA